MQRYADNRYLIAKSQLPIKKDRLGNLSLTDRGDRIRNCDLVLPKD